jgi:hypothetical protein
VKCSTSPILDVQPNNALDRNIKLEIRKTAKVSSLKFCMSFRTKVPKLEHAQ